MKQTAGYFESLSGQRYYHVVGYESKNYSINDYWNDCKISKKNIEASYEIAGFYIQHAKYTTPFRFHNGEEDFSVNLDGKAPYKYDLFAIEIKKLNLLILGFPFKNLAKTLVNTILNERPYSKKQGFVKPELNKLIKIGNSESEFAIDNFFTHFSGVELILTGETNISSVNLDGDKPLDSNLYKNVFLDKIENDECFVDKCSLKCETLNSSNEYHIPKSKAIVHLDLFGNYKIYIHGHGKNIVTIPFLFTVLSKFKCLKTTFSNPIQRLKNE